MENKELKFGDEVYVLAGRDGILPAIFIAYPCDRAAENIRLSCLVCSGGELMEAVACNVYPVSHSEVLQLRRSQKEKLAETDEPALDRAD